MDSKSTPARSQSGGTRISRRTVTRGVAWSAPIAAVAYAAPAFAVSEPPVVASQCGVACKHPGGKNKKTYHFTFCFKATGAIDNNQVTVTTMSAGADCRAAFAGVGNKIVTLVNNAACSYIDAPDFKESSTDAVVLYFTYKIGGETFFGCASGQVTGDVCGTGQSPLRDNPKDWPHDNGVGDEGLGNCTPTQTACTASPACTPNPGS
jgi:hypothetical protein